MVDFSLTKKQISMQKMARDFTKKEIIPVSKELDQANEIKFSLGLYRKLAQNNFTVLMIPEKYGGAGLDCFSAGVIVEELAVGCAAIAFTSASNFVTALPVILAGNDEQKEKFLPIFL